jgi:hypothetical protein
LPLLCHRCSTHWLRYCLFHPPPLLEAERLGGDPNVIQGDVDTGDGERDEDHEEDRDEEILKRPLLSEGIVAAATEGLVVAAIPAAAYLSAYLYEVGFAWRFRIPLTFIKVSLTTVLAAASALLYAAGLSFALVTLLLIQEGVSLAEIRTRIVSVTSLSQLTTRRVFLSAVLLIIYLLTVYGYGYLGALLKIEFLVTSTSPEMVVLTVYGDEMICYRLLRLVGLLPKPREEAPGESELLRVYRQLPADDRGRLLAIAEALRGKAG